MEYSTYRQNLAMEKTRVITGSEILKPSDNQILFILKVIHS